MSNTFEQLMEIGGLGVVGRSHRLRTSGAVEDIRRARGTLLMEEIGMRSDPNKWEGDCAPERLPNHRKPRKVEYSK